MHSVIQYNWSWSVQLVLVSTAGPGQYNWSWSISLVFFLGGTLTSVSLTVTQFSLLAVDSLLEALLDALGDAELLLKYTSMFLIRVHALFILVA